MNLDYSPRGAGKTTRAIEWLRKDPPNRWLAVSTISEADRLSKLYPDVQERITTWDIIIKMRGTLTGQSKSPRIFVDNADMFIQRMLDWNVTDVSFSKDEIDLRKD